MSSGPFRSNSGVRARRGRPCPFREAANRSCLGAQRKPCGVSRPFDGRAGLVDFLAGYAAANRAASAAALAWGPPRVHGGKPRNRPVHDASAPPLQSGGAIGEGIVDNHRLAGSQLARAEVVAVGLLLSGGHDRRRIGIAGGQAASGRSWRGRARLSTSPAWTRTPSFRTPARAIRRQGYLDALPSVAAWASRNPGDFLLVLGRSATPSSGSSSTAIAARRSMSANMPRRSGRREPRRTPPRRHSAAAWAGCRLTVSGVLGGGEVGWASLPGRPERRRARPISMSRRISTRRTESPSAGNSR